jgi:hypothetical protein
MKTHIKFIILSLIVVVETIAFSGEAFAWGNCLSGRKERSNEMKQKGEDWFTALPNEMKQEVVQKLSYWDMFRLAQTNVSNYLFVCGTRIPCREFSLLDEKITELNQLKGKNFGLISRKVKEISGHVESMKKLFPVDQRMEEFEKDSYRLITRRVKSAFSSVSEFPGLFDLDVEQKANFLKEIARVSWADFDFLDNIKKRLNNYQNIHRAMAGEDYPGQYYMERRETLYDVPYIGF